MSKQDWLFLAFIVTVIVLIGRMEKRCHEAELRFKEEIRDEKM